MKTFTQHGFLIGLTLAVMLGFLAVAITACDSAPAAPPTTAPSPEDMENCAIWWKHLTHDADPSVEPVYQVSVNGCVSTVAGIQYSHRETQANEDWSRPHRGSIKFFDGSGPTFFKPGQRWAQIVYWAPGTR